MSSYDVMQGPRDTSPAIRFMQPAESGQSGWWFEVDETMTNGGRGVMSGLGQTETDLQSIRHKESTRDYDDSLVVDVL